MAKITRRGVLGLIGALPIAAKMPWVSEVKASPAVELKEVKDIEVTFSESDSLSFSPSEAGGECEKCGAWVGDSPRVLCAACRDKGHV